MKLIKARVQKYKCVDDSGAWPVDQVTCLVGKNESGKSALLEALYKLNPVEENESFLKTDYPRKSALTDGGKKDIENAQAIITHWTLEEEDRDLLGKELPELDIQNGAVIEISKGYSGRIIWDVEIDEKEAVSTLISNARFNAAEKSSLGNPKTIQELLQILKSINRSTEKQRSFLEKVGRSYPSGHAMSGVWTCLKKVFPHFIYFREYERLPGRVSINELIRREEYDELSFELRIFQALLELANSSARKIADAPRSEEMIMQLEAVSNRISDEIFEYWSQNRHLSVEFRCDMARPGDPEPFNEGYVFQTRIKNERHRATVNFDERSTGFIWFFSFLIWFSQMRENYGDKLVVLLDEPGLTLHGKAQQDLLRYIRERLQPSHQVIYTTHSPFMLDVEKIFSLRTVEDMVSYKRVGGRDVEEFHGTKVGQQILSRDQDTILPLQGHLGYDIASTLFVGPYVLVVEGPSEFTYLHWFARQLASQDREGLDLRWAIAPAEGASKVTSFVTLFKGRGLKIAALMDYHDDQKGMVDKLLKSKLIDEEHLLKTTDFVKQEEADIEDLIGWPLYVHLVNEALDLPALHRLPAERPEDAEMRIVKEVEKRAKLFPPAIAGFNHFVATEYLGSVANERIPDLPGLNGALDNFERLFRRLNGLIEQH